MTFHKWYQIRNGTSIFLMMKLQAVFLLLGALQVSAAGFSQPVSFRGANVSLEEVFTAINEQTDYSVFYNYSLLEGTRPVNLDVRDASVEEVLNTSLRGQALTYSIEDKLVLIKRKEQAAATPPAQPVVDTVTVSGTVTGEDGMTLPGVSVQVKETSQGVMTDVEGRYELRGVDEGAVLVFSYVGFQTREIPVGGRTEIDVALQPDISSLEEVVVVGYGEQSRAKVTSAVSTIDADKLAEIPTNTVTSVLQGKVAGVRILQNSGQPGQELEVRVRGGSSINKSNAPLYIIDGFPREVNDVNPQDIESVSVLKDAAATAIYGARASNGVVLITTKKGKQGAANIDFNYTLGYQEFPRQIDVLSAEQFLQIMRPAHQQSVYKDGEYFSGAQSTGTGNDESSTWTTRFLEDGEQVPPGWKTTTDPVTGRTLVFQDNNWQDILFRQAMQANYYLSANGGTENIKYYAGIGYTDQQGVAIGTQWDRFSGRSNVDFQLNDKFSMGTSVDFTLSRTNRFENEANIFTRGAFIAPTGRDYFADGTPGHGNNANLANPMWVAHTRDNDRTNTRTNLGLNADWEIIENLHFRPRANYFVHNYERNYFEYENFYNNQRPAQAQRDKRSSWQYEMLLSYDFTLNDNHDFSALAGMTDLYLQNDDVTAATIGASTDHIPTVNAGPEFTNATSSKSEERLIGYFARLNYSYRDKYLVEANIRRDGSSKFGRGNQVGYFPSASAGWILTEEPFMSGVTGTLSHFKLRASYGVTGNNDIGRYVAQGNYNPARQYGGNAGIRAVAMPNPLLRWEKTASFDVGFDLRLFTEKPVEILFDYYSRESDNLLFELQLPRETGFNTLETNIGSVRYTGFEVGISSTNISNSDFTWTTDFNIAYNTNEVLRLPDRPGVDKNRINGIIFADGTGVGGIAEGERLNQIIGYQVDRLLDNPEEAANALHDELAYGYSPEDEEQAVGRKFPGDFEWVDHNGDGRITDLDQFVLGYSEPRTTGGLSNTFRYKQFDLTVFTDFALGHSIQDQARGWSNGIGARDISPTTDILSAWQQPGDAARTGQPRVVFHDVQGQRNHTRPSSFYTYSADFLCIRDVRLGYNLPAKWTGKLGLSRLRLHVAGNNLYYFTKYPGFSPERGGRIGHQQGRYPSFRTLVFGVNVGF